MKARDALLWVAKLAISAALLAWVFSNQDVRAGLRGASFLHPWYLVGAVIVGGASLLFAAWRWYVCLHAYECALPFATVLRFLLAGNAAGLLSIGPVGMDAVRGALAMKRLPDRKGAVIASIALDHLCAIPAVALLAVTIVTSMGLSASVSRSTIFTGLASAAVLVAAGIVIEMIKPGVHRRLLAPFTQRLNVRGASIAAVLALPVLVLHYAVFWCAAQALGISANGAGLFGAIVIADSIAALPITIAGIGFREKSLQVLLLKWYAVPAALSVKTSLAGFAVLAVWAIVGALCFPLGNHVFDKPAAANA